MEITIKPYRKHQRNALTTQELRKVSRSVIGSGPVSKWDPTTNGANPGCVAASVLKLFKFFLRPTQPAGFRDIPLHFPGLRDRVINPGLSRMIRDSLHLCKMGLRNWSLVGNKRWLLLGGSKCTIFVIVAIGGAWFGLFREVGRFSEMSLTELLLYNTELELKTFACRNCLA